ncbi:arsenate reductase (glutaredoxin) [Flagellimonas allohymeniacidonis]|uniref:Arsenate reductase (Glutaredoxin) n=1 Tax=Flagellimonas allohymeniacidonis TaxID=2517819 RepID=A0A4Q8QIW9_9FLAO|nr:arsenate reductase (glutaredoxin) [Allomuricauda hymeniacidonis]TAI48663.1 arsenate reductase (glutaredoxin) [Allomuricauda hymeniacidonis]
MLKIYHNPRCRKSREGLAYLQEKGLDFEEVRYLDEIPSQEKLAQVLGYLGMKPMELVRTNEAVWKEKYKGKNLSDSEIIKAMVENPKLIERPIVVNGDKAVVARPAERIKDIL